MCFSLWASLVAGTIGQLTALYLLLYSPHRAIGAWIATYSLIQFYEAAAYAGLELRGALKPLLYAQGAALCLGKWAETRTPAYGALAAAVVLLCATDASEAARFAVCRGECSWNVSWRLVGMYTAMFAWGMHGAKTRALTCVYAATLALAFAMRGRATAPSAWCALSAFAAPVAAVALQYGA